MEGQDGSQSLNKIIPEKIPCLQCDYKAPEKYSLKRHHVDIHERLKYPCDRCDAELSRANLIRHKQIFHGLQRFQCDQCEYHGEDKLFLKAHKDISHQKVAKIFFCDVCDHQSTTKNNLKKHKEAKHEEKKFSCDSCDYLASTERIVQKHKDR